MDEKLKKLQEMKKKAAKFKICRKNCRKLRKQRTNGENYQNG